MSLKVALIGSGNMGAALARGFVQSGNCEAKDLLLVDSDAGKLQLLQDELGCETGPSFKDLTAISEIDLLILAVKPQSFDGLAVDLIESLSSETVLVSVMAGVSLEHIQKKLPSSLRVVRAMPNLPASIRAGVTVLFASENCQRAEVEQVNRLFSSVGETLEVEREDLVHAATALSGSGPGFLFHLLSGALEAAKELGFTSEQSETLVFQTVIGSLQLWRDSPESADTWGERVTSPKGTTEAGLSVLQAGSAQTLIQDSVRTAFARAKELSNG